MTLPFAALGALIAALLETTVLPEIQIAGTQADLVLALAVVATIVLGAEDGLAWAFIGGLMLDMLIPARPIGAATLSLLLVVGIAVLGVRFAGRGHRVLAVLAVFALSWIYHLVLLAVLIFTEGVVLGTYDLRVVFAAAVMNTAIAIPAAMLFAVVERRFGSTERVDW